MDEISINIVVGVVSGLATAGVLFLIGQLVNKALIPWIKKLSYKGIEVDGTWYQYKPRQKVLLELKQDCSVLTGKATVILTATGPNTNNVKLDSLRTFDVTGEIHNGFISLNAVHSNSQKLGIHCHLLQVVNDGSILQGHSSWYSPVAGKITSGSSEFYREESMAELALQSKVEEN